MVAELSTTPSAEAASTPPIQEGSFCGPVSIKMAKFMKRFIFTTLIVVAAVSSALAQGAAGKWAKFDGNKIHYYDTGVAKGKTALVLVHGWTCSADFWSRSVNAFPQYRVIALDLPGHGLSDKPKANYTMEYFARSIDAVLKEAKVQKAVLAGHSMGTPVVRQYYRLFPQKTLGIVIVDGALRPFATAAQMEKYVEPLRTDYKPNAAKMVDGMLAPMKNADLKTWIRDAMLATPDFVALSAWSGMADDAIWGKDQIKVPVLTVLAAGQWPADTEEFNHSIAPQQEFHMWTGVSHFLMMERPTEFNELVAAFISKNKLL